MARRRTAALALAGALGSGALAGGCADTSTSGGETPALAPDYSSTGPAQGDDGPAGRAGASPDALHPAVEEALDGRLRVAADAAALASGLRAADRLVQDPDTPEDVLAAAARVQQVAYRRLAQRPRWDDTVLRRLPRKLRAATRANVSSRREFLSMHTNPGDTLPAWRIVAPEPADELLSYYREAQRRFGVDWEYLAAINLVETGMGRIRGTSVAGAQGPMQFMPATWEQYGRGDVHDPRDAILAAARYLDARGFSEPGGRPGALYAYNNHPAYVRGVTRIAEVMQERPRAFRAYHRWQVYYRTEVGDVLLPVGYDERRSVDVRRWLRRHPSATVLPGPG
ncbi:transglycosylase SLT domain-containing protein [Nocardioides sp. SYSU DS0663]|uniref:lytic transglycosylase domain-containing protein n=1 Tax=Nocardioides sp. SYSU DS0663 TaxID=3416445 RepID=UPI003F4C263A